MFTINEEQKYDFRRRMVQGHRADIRDFSLTPDDNEYEIKNGFSFVGDFGIVVKNAVDDFCAFMKRSLAVDAGSNGGITLKIADDLGEYNTYKGRRVEVGDGIVISAYDERGLAQAIYDLEDVLALRRAPFIKKDTYYRKPMYAPMMVQSGWGHNEYPDEYLREIARSGRDTIMILTGQIIEGKMSYDDCNDIIKRAAAFGLDAYAYSHYHSEKHPEDEGAEEHYESTYGALFKACPGFKGVLLVGEAVEFPSRDERVSDKPYYANTVDGIHTGKLSPGWFPCRDYPKWLAFLSKIIYKYVPDMDIIFWTYNWFKAPEADRIALIENLPEGITLQATFEMGQQYKTGEYSAYSADYSLFFEGPCDYFSSEAKAAKKRGLKLYSMTNTGGMTWDFGVIPFEPMPQQWQKRYKAMEMAHDEWGLSGIKESLDYGVYPSILTRLSKWTFTEPRIPYDKLLRDCIEIEYGPEHVDTLIKAFEYWSEAITYYTPTASDQYGAFRIGTAYPFNLDRTAQLQPTENGEEALGICVPTYMEGPGGIETSFIGLRIPEEIKSLEKMCDTFKIGLDIVDAIENPSEPLQYLINMAHYMYHTMISGVNAKRWYMLKCDAKASRCREKLIPIVDEMEALLIAERKNAEDSIEFVKRDSRLGWETGMDYIGDEWHIRWKMRQIDYVLNTEIKNWQRTART